MIGIKRLAKHLNMSISTVSRALNDRPDSSEATRKRVREAAAKLGYVPNQSGRNLRSGTTGTIGFMMKTGPEIIGQGHTHFFMNVLDGVQEVLLRHKLDLIALLCASTEDEDDYLRRVVSRGVVDGLIISNTRRVDPRISFLADRKVPFVGFGRSTTDVGQPWIDIDFETIATESINRLVARGHKRIAIGMPHDDINLGHVFQENARHALVRHGLTLDPQYIYRSLPSETGGYEIAQKIVGTKNRPTAIVLSNESSVIGLYRGLMEHGILPGRDIAVIGLYSSISQYLSPTLTGFHLSLHDLGVALGEALLASMSQYADSYPLGIVRKLWPVTLIPRESDAFTFIKPAKSVPEPESEQLSGRTKYF
ncbi:MAG TPA: LacI family DNA-binding transcriptional regulator [Aestuariivirga sp.]